MRTTTKLIVAAVIAATTQAASAAGADEWHGFYYGVGAGVAGADFSPGTATATEFDRRDGALKLFGGYQIDRHFGAEVGYLRTGNYSQTILDGGAAVRQDVKSHAWYAAGTGRIDIGHSFALTGKIGMAYGEVTGDRTVGGADSLLGRERSAFFGMGAQYLIGRSGALQFDIEGVDKLSSRVSAGTMTLSWRQKF